VQCKHRHPGWPAISLSSAWLSPISRLFIYQ
jgi:hypothetical protein